MLWWIMLTTHCSEEAMHFADDSSHGSVKDEREENEQVAGAVLQRVARADARQQKVRPVAKRGRFREVAI